MVDLVAKIKAKKEFSVLNDNFVQRRLDAYLRSKKIDVSGLHGRSAAVKDIVKEIRSELREIYGAFQVKGFHKRWKLLEEYVSSDFSEEVLEKLFLSHQSTAERAPYYKELYAKLFSRPVGSILDLGCGLNPLSYRYLGFSPTYECCDVSSEDVQFLNSFFEECDITGSAFVVDLLDERVFKADVVFMFKLVDTLESQERNLSKKLIKKLDCKKVVVSFATKSLGGRVFRKGKKNWFSRFLEEEGFGFEKVVLPNEEFWVILK